MAIDGNGSDDAMQREYRKPLRRWEVWCWWLYELATAAYGSGAITFFFPLLAEHLAQRYAWETQLGKERPPACSDTSDGEECVKCVPGQGEVLVENGGEKELPNVRIDVGAISVDPVAYASFCISMSILLQVVFYLVLGPAADYGHWRRSILLVATVIGGSLTSLAGIVHKPRHYWAVGVLLVLTNSLFGLAFVAYNSWLPILVDADARVMASRERGGGSFRRTRVLVSNELSAKGLAIGYVGALVALFICFSMSFSSLSRTSYYGWTLVLSGVWWLVFGIAAIVGLPTRAMKKAKGFLSPFAQGMSELASTLRMALARPNLFKFLLIFFFYSDGYSTISSVGILFAQRDVCMSTSGLGLLTVEVPLAALFGSIFFMRIQSAFDLSSKSILVTNLGIISGLGLYAQIGWLTSPQGIGLKTAAEMHIFAIVYGSQLGSVQSFSRTVFGDMVPEGSEGQFYSLYQVTDRGSSWLGPLIVTTVVQATNSLRLALIYVVLVLVIPAIALWRFVDHKQGLVESGRMVMDDHHQQDESNEEGEELTLIQNLRAES